MVDAWDTTLHGLISDTAAGWTMPPRSIDPTAWHARVGDARARRFRWSADVLRFRPAGAGLALAVIAALAVAISAAVVTTRPGPSSSPGASSSDRASAGVQVFGAPLPEQQIVVNDSLGWRLLSIARGTLGASVEPLARSNGGHVFALPGGRFLCVCSEATYTRPGDASPGPSASLEQVLVITLRFMDGAGTETRESMLPALVGVVDPASPSLDVVSIQPTVSGQGDVLYLGWVARSAGAWQSGIEVVDLGSGHTLQSVRFDDVPLVTTQNLVPWAPEILLAPDGSHLLAVRPIARADGSLTVDRFSATVDAGRIGVPSKMAARALPTDSCGPTGDQGFAGPGALFALCASSGGQVVRRVDLAGNLLGDTPLPDQRMGYYGALATDPSGTTLYAWGPSEGTLTRVDLASGRITGRLSIPQAGTAVASAGGLDGLLGALVPTALGKEFILPSIVVAPDGRRVYLLGTTSQDPAGAGSSTGVWVVDSASFQLAAHWSPRADLSSIAITPDGAFVIAAGRPGADAQGRSDPSIEASVSVYDASSGKLRLFSSSLGSNDLSFGQALGG